MPADAEIQDFDPSQPFQIVPRSGGAAPAFDPSKPFQVVPEKNPVNILPPATGPMTGVDEPYSTSSPGYAAYQNRLARSFATTPEQQAEEQRALETGFVPVLSQPTVKLPRAQSSPGDSFAKAAGKALLNTGEGLGEFFTSPLGAATGLVSGGSMLARRAIAAAFAADMAKNVPASSRTAGEASVNGNLQQQIEADIGMGANVALPGFLAGGAVGPKLGDFLKRPEPLPEPPPIEPLQLGQGTRFQVGPEGTTAEVQQLSPKEQTEFQRSVAAGSRQFESGQQRVVNTVAAGLEAVPPGVKQMIPSNGTDWYKQGEYWVTDKPLSSMEKTTLKAGRGNPVEDAIVADLEAKQQMKLARLQPGKTAAQQTVEDTTGVTREKPTPATATDLAFREQWEKQVNQRWASPQSEYGPNGALSARQQQRLDNLGKYLSSEKDESNIERLYASVQNVQPKYPYDIQFKQMLESRLGIKPQLPPEAGGAAPAPTQPGPPAGGPNAIQESGARSLLQHPPEGAGEAGGGRGRVEQGQQGNEAAQTQTGQAVPQEISTAAKVAAMPDEQPLPKNFTKDALEYGASLKSPEQVQELMALAVKAKQQMAAIPKNMENFGKIAGVGNKLQWFNEALEGATGAAGEKDTTLKAILGENYKAPFPEFESQRSELKKGKVVTPNEPVQEKVQEEKRGVLTPSKNVELVNTTMDVPSDVLDRAMKKAVPEAAKSAPAKNEFPKFLTEAWGDTEPPPKGAGAVFSAERLKKAGLTREYVTQELNRLAENRDPEAILKVLEKSRTPSGALTRIMIEVPRLTKAERETLSKAEAAMPKPASVAEQNFNQQIKPAETTPEQKEMVQWQKAWITKSNAGNYTEAALKAADDFIASMKEKHGVENPNDMPGMEAFKRQEEKLKSARKNPPVQVTETKRPEIGSRVTRTIEGKTETGEVFARGGDAGTLMVKFGPAERPLVEPLSDDWKLAGAEQRPAALPKKPISDNQFLQMVRDASGLKSKDFKNAFSTSLAETAPDLMKNAQAVVEQLHDRLRERGIDPESKEANQTEEGRRANDIINFVASAAKEQERVNRNFSSASRAKAESDLEVARKHIQLAADFMAGVKPGLESEIKSVIDQNVRVSSRRVAGNDRAVEMLEQAGYKKYGQWWLPGNQKPPTGQSGFGITPQPPEWMRKFAEEDVAPFVKRGVDAVRATRDLIINLFSPETHAIPRDVDALFESKGAKEKFITQAAAAVEGARDMMNGMSKEQQIAFVNRIKLGRKQPTPELQQLAELIRKWDDRLHAEASKYKPDLAYLDNHYRVLWKVIPGTADKTGTALEQIMSKRPWRGSRGFTLQHTLEDMSEGIAKGGVPVSYNPIENFLLHAQDVMKFVAANRAWESLKKSGSAVLVERGEEAPPGFSRLNDTIARQYFKTKDTKPGEWYVESGVARMINNYLSVDYIRQGPAGPIGRGLVDLKNITTAVELGLSPFHAIFETNETVGSSMGLAIAKMASGRFVEGAGEFAKAVPGTIPVVGGLIPKAASMETFKLGSKIVEYAKNPEEFEQRYPDAYKFLKKNYPGFEQLVDDLFSAGGQVSMHDSYHIQAAKGFREAVANDNYVGAVVRAVPAISQKMLQPLFEVYIPRLKVGTFAREYSFELSRRAEDLASGKITRSELARQTWAFVEDRFGELNWDNLYWNRTFKSAMQLAFRSVTWKLGNIRGFGKALRDLSYELGHGWYSETPMGAAVRAGIKEGPAKAVEAFRNAPSGDIKPPRITMPMGWLIGMALVTSIQSSIISKTLTGKYPWELAETADDVAKNMTFPRIDKDDPSQRVSIPTYWKDMVHLLHNIPDYIHSSMTGEIGRAMDTWNNRDFYGRQVYNPDDPLLIRVKDIMEHMIPVPFSLGSFVSAKQSGASNVKSAAGFLGYTKAPYYVSHTKAEQKADELIRNQLPQGSRTKEQYQKTVNERQIMSAVKRGETTLQEAENKGLIPARRGFDLSRHMDYTQLQEKVSRLGANDALKVWVIANPKEQAQIKDMITRKIFNSETLTPEEKEGMTRLLDNQPTKAPAPAFNPNQPFQRVPR